MHAVVADWEIAAGSGIDEVERDLPRSVVAKTAVAARQFELELILRGFAETPELCQVLGKGNFGNDSGAGASWKRRCEDCRTQANQQ